jgi:hypothetical protein
MSGFVSYYLKIRRWIFNACRNGDYVTISTITDQILQGNFSITGVLKRGDKYITDTEAKTLMFEEYFNIKMRYPGLLVQEIPAHASTFIPTPKFPIPICFNYHTSGIVNVLQLLFIIHPIRKVYLHSRWRDGVPNPTIDEDPECKQLLLLHEAITAFFWRIIPFCREVYYLSSCEGGDIPMDIMALPFVLKTDPISFLNLVINTLFKTTVYKHPAFEKAYKRALSVLYSNSEGVVRETYVINLHVDLFQDTSFTFSQILFPKPFHDSHEGIMEYVSFSDYIIFTLTYDPLRTHNVCKLEETLTIEPKKETFSLVAAVYSHHSSLKTIEYFTIAKYGGKWYHIDRPGARELDFQKSQQNISFTNTLQIVIYKKQISLKLK